MVLVPVSNAVAVEFSARVLVAETLWWLFRQNVVLVAGLNLPKTEEQ